MSGTSCPVSVCCPPTSGWDNLRLNSRVLASRSTSGKQHWIDVLVYSFIIDQIILLMNLVIHKLCKQDSIASELISTSRNRTVTEYF